MLPFHNGPVICENIITKILFASCPAKISYRKNFRVYSISCMKHHILSVREAVDSYSNHPIVLHRETPNL